MDKFSFWMLTEPPKFTAELMMESREILALFQLLDDPDEEVFDSVSNRICTYGKPLIPQLEQLWEQSHQIYLQERIELLIHRLHFNDLQTDLLSWNKAADNPDLLTGVWIVSRYLYPDLPSSQILLPIDRLKRAIWLELNNQLTPLEQVNVFNRIFYGYYKFAATNVDYAKPEHFFLHNMLESKKGNALITGILFTILSDLLDIPVKLLSFPNHVVLGFWHPSHPLFEAFRREEFAQEKISFYIEPQSGMIISHAEVMKYFQRNNLTAEDHFFEPMSNRGIIQLWLRQLSQCYQSNLRSQKTQELQNLANLLDETA